MTEIDFCETRHLYCRDGEIYPSVTEVLQKAGLINGSWFSEYAACRGAALHLATAFLDRNELEESSVDGAIAGRLDAYRHFKEDTGFKPTHIEHILYSDKWKCAGTADRLGVLSENLILLDLKSGAALPWHSLQTAAYQMMALERGHAVTKRFGLELRDNGTYRLREHKDAMDLARFLQALKAATA